MLQNAWKKLHHSHISVVIPAYGFPLPHKPARTMVLILIGHEALTRRPVYDDGGGGGDDDNEVQP